MVTCNVVSLPLNAAIIRNPGVVSPETALTDAVSQLADLQTDDLEAARCGPGNLDATQGFWAHRGRSSCLVVVDAGAVAGLITERDIVRLKVQSADWQGRLVGEAILCPPVILPESDFTSVALALDLLMRHGAEHLLLVNDRQQLTGLVTHATLCQVVQKQQNGSCLRTKEQCHMDVLQSLPVGIFRRNRERENIYVNERHCQILGLPRDTTLGDAWQRGVWPEDRDHVLRGWDMSVAENPFQLEYRFRRPGGDVIWIYEQWVADCDDEGHVVGYVGTIADISDRKKMELALAQSEAKNRAILAAIPDYLFCLDSNGVYRDVVTYQKDIALFPAHINPVGLTMADVLPKDVAQRQQYYLDKIFSTGTLQAYEQQVRRGNRICDEEVRVVKSGEDEALFIVRDISDRKQTERQLQSLIEGTAATTGQDFFPALVRYVATALGVAYAVVTELVDGELHTLAFWANGALHPPMSYNPVQTPCERSLEAGQFFSAALKAQDFAGDIDLAAMGVKSYLGIALCGSHNEAIGNLCILDQKTIRAPRRAEQILRVFAARATAELERHRALDSLEQLNQALEIKVAERTAALQRREQFLQAVLDTFPISVFWKDLNSVYLGCNRNFLRDAGLTDVSEMVGKNDYDMPWGAGHAVHAQEDDRAVMESNAAKLGIEETLVKADGQQIWLETNKMPLRNLAGDVEGVLGIYQDITVRKQLELELQHSQKQLSEVLDSAIASITRLRLYPDRSIHYEYISPHCASALGYTVDELLSDPECCQTCFDPDDWETVITPVIDILLTHRGPSTHQMEYRLHRRDGSIFWVIANCSAQWNESGGYWDVTCVETDISDRKNAEAQLQNLMAGTVTVGQDFFPALVRHIADALSVSHVVVNEYANNQLQSLAVWSNGELQPNTVKPLTPTPCSQTIQHGLFYCEKSVQQQFPNNAKLRAMEAESYLGIVLRDTKDNVIGILCIIHQKPLPHVQRAIQILQIFAARAAAELERQRANMALEQLNQALEVKVIERTAELREREQFLQTVLDTFPLNIFWKDLNSVYLGGNRNFLAHAGLTSLSEIQGKTDYDLPWTALEVERYRADDSQVIQSNAPKLGIIASRRKADGQQIWTEINKLPLHNLNGQVIGVLGSFQDITEHQEAQATIKQQVAAIEAAIDGIGILKNDIYIYVNQAQLDLFGYEHPDDLLGKSWRTLYSPYQIAKFEQEILPILGRDHAWQGESVATRKDGSTFPQGVSLTLMDDGLTICVCRDISDLKQAQQQIIHNALHDPLTGLPNRSLLVEKMDLALERAQRLDAYQYAVLFLDLDRFKVINDSLGHLVGDKLLVAVANRLKQHLRNTDMVARLGGDEFVILLEEVATVDDIVQIAERILNDFQTPVLIDGHKIFTSTSIGIVIGSEAYGEASNLIRDADIAMYRAKAHERNSYKFFDGAMHTEAVSRLTLETDLRRALIQQEFVVHYQPIFSLWNRTLVGFEALVRWHHPIRGLVSPDDFMPVLEEMGLVSSLDSWVMHEACGQMARWQRQFPHCFPLKISINLSALDLRNTNLLEDVDSILNNSELPGELIVLEITERMLIEDIDRTIDLLMDLAIKRIQVSIDDFGTGYSSLSYLHRLPVHNLKIDRSFVGQMHSHNRNYQVVSTILAMSKQLGLAVVAEGIETPQHLQQLQQLDCEFGQGYLFAKPLTSRDVELLLAQERSNQSYRFSPEV
ncbi:EAL domain-containing protein [Leptothoe kymatousa]|uniref:EAL domain-containing protein n=1 Tax=Leptothoe kymatousa TAU-MAC 1615 TaxID=2364775 RepID=A0ABS5Y0H0_9CYAN|nr:EAL domain-containing protein [Leptothoe kymatousa]MBT9310978.1 EAL domain-containing protein [Leptothoe kymatousa TAU-MAC 1615]